MTITTENNQEITSKTDYIKATLSICDDNNEDNNYTAEIQIRGRGNHTWLVHPKKPYKIKLPKKASLLGLPANKHWALMAHWLVGNWDSNFLGFEMARLMDMGWQPHMIPVEVVLNDKFLGLYFLQETIRIDKGRLEIFEQKDENEDPDIVPYGWLVEIDNTNDDNQIKVDEWPGGRRVNITHHSPETLSPIQSQWLTDEFTSLGVEIYNGPDDQGAWTDKLDIRSIVRYFIIRELLYDGDGFWGSFYFHKDKGENAKWKAGPLWDCTLRNIEHDNFMCFSFDLFDYDTWGKYIEGIVKYDEFWDVLRQEWEDFYPEKFNAAFDAKGQIEQLVVEPMLNDWGLWPGPSKLYNMSHPNEGFDYVKNVVENNALIFDYLIKNGVTSGLPSSINNQSSVFNVRVLSFAEKIKDITAFNATGSLVRWHYIDEHSVMFDCSGIILVNVILSDGSTTTLKLMIK